MEAIIGLAQQLVYALLSLMPSAYQRENLEAMLGLFLEAQGHPLPQHSQSKSASALSRFPGGETSQAESLTGWRVTHFVVKKERSFFRNKTYPNDNK